MRRKPLPGPGHRHTQRGLLTGGGAPATAR
jgi:hypothetical protein